MADIILKDSWTEIIFRDKNQKYGAYELRHLYTQYTNRALIIAIIVFSAAIAAPLLLSFIDFGKDKENEMIDVNLELLPPPPIDPNTPPPPPPPKIELPKLVASVKFLPPKVEEDEKVQDEEPPTVDDMKDKQIATVNQEGEKSSVDVIEETPHVIEEPKAEEVFLVVEEMPEFEGGQAGMMKYIQKNISYPKQASAMGLEGRVIVSFVINGNGEVADVQVLKGIGGGCDEEAMRVIKSLPKWKPGKQNGRAVSVKFTVPIKFALQ
ncbi:MAG: energy transducer TonB [Bacteroidota bacterium]|nr:energy transducer TonB [Bacteroidota bacterium]